MGPCKVKQLWWHEYRLALQLLVKNWELEPKEIWGNSKGNKKVTKIKDPKQFCFKVEFFLERKALVFAEITKPAISSWKPKKDEQT